MRQPKLALGSYVTLPAQGRAKRGKQRGSPVRAALRAVPWERPLEEEEGRHLGAVWSDGSFVAGFSNLFMHQNHLETLNKFWSPGHAPHHVNQNL